MIHGLTNLKVQKVLKVFVFDVRRAVGSNPSNVGRYQNETKEYSFF
jgi:hypothetical protein